MGMYSASKWAVEAINESMAGEVRAFGIHTTLIEPNRYDTEWAGASAVRSKNIDDYHSLKSAVFSQIQRLPAGDPAATAAAILKIVDAETPPLRVFFGKVGLPWLKNVYAERLSLWEQWSELSDAAQG